jgi:hypothetical protein
MDGDQHEINTVIVLGFFLKFIYRTRTAVKRRAILCIFTYNGIVNLCFFICVAYFFGFCVTDTKVILHLNTIIVMKLKTFSY